MMGTLGTASRNTDRVARLFASPLGTVTDMATANRSKHSMMWASGSTTSRGSVHHQGGKVRFRSGCGRNLAFRSLESRKSFA